MALIKCSRCGAKISNKAVSCPKCGNSQFIRCEECRNEISVYTKGACPECGNPDIRSQIADYFAQQSDIKPEEVENISKTTDDEMKFRLFIGLYFSLLVSYWITAGFTRYSLLQLFPITIVLFFCGALFPKIFGFITFIGIFFHLYQISIQLM